MSLLDRWFGPPAQRQPDTAKSVSFQYDTAPDVVAGYPSIPLFDSYGVMYRRQPAVRTVVDFIASNIAQLNPKIYDRVGTTDRREWPEHPVAELLHHPNPNVTRSRHLFATIADQCIYDRAYWRRVRQGGITRAVVRIPPSRMVIEVDQETLATTYRYRGVVIPRNDLVIFPGYHPDGGEEGVSPLETLRRVLAEEWASSTNREWYWRNGARIGGVVERPLDAPDWTPEARDAFMAIWRESTRGGVNSGKPAMLEDGMKWVTGGFSPKDSEYIEGRQFTYTEVARVYAPALAGLLAEAPTAGVESFHRQLYQDVLGPRLRALQDEIDLQLLGADEFDAGGNPYCEFNLAEKLKGSFDEMADTLVRSVGVPYMSINEGRARLNLPRLDGEEYDEPIQPMNVIYGGQPSVVTPTADPGTPPALASLDAFYDRQAGVLKSRLGSGRYDWWQTERWDRELADIVGVDEAKRLNARHLDAIMGAGATIDAVTAVLTPTRQGDEP